MNAFILTMLCIGAIAPIASIYKAGKTDKTRSDVASTIIAALLLEGAWILAIIFQTKNI